MFAAVSAGDVTYVNGDIMVGFLIEHFMGVRDETFLCLVLFLEGS